MKAEEIMTSRGQVTPSFLNLRTGERQAWPQRHNTISYQATASMAAAFAGVMAYVPNRMGIVYGDAGILFETIDRNQDWDTFGDQLQDKNADVQIVPFSYSPSVKEVEKTTSGSSSSADSPADSETANKGNAVVFHAHSDSSTAGYFNSYHDSSSTDGSIFLTGSHIYQAVLLNKSVGSGYRIIARAFLDSEGTGSGTFYTKPEGFEVAIDWTIKFF